MRGIGRFAASQARDVRPEQSYEPGPSAPQTYGLPICAVAKATAAAPASLASPLTSLTAPEESQAVCALFAASCSNWRSRSRSFFSSRDSSFSAALIWALIFFLALACLTRFASSFSQLALASWVYVSRSCCVWFSSVSSDLRPAGSGGPC